MYGITEGGLSDEFHDFLQFLVAELLVLDEEREHLLRGAAEDRVAHFAQHERDVFLAGEQGRIDKRPARALQSAMLHVALRLENFQEGGHGGAGRPWLVVALDERQHGEPLWLVPPEVHQCCFGAGERFQLLYVHHACKITQNGPPGQIFASPFPPSARLFNIYV